MKYLVFYSTSDVFAAEEVLNNNKISCEIVPTPVTDKAYCGVCIKTSAINFENLLMGLEYRVVTI